MPETPTDHRLKEALWTPYVEDIALACLSFDPHIDTALIVAIGLRETWLGTCPGYVPKGPNGVGDGGHGRGLFQIDDRGPFKTLIPPAGADWPVIVQAQSACKVVIDAQTILTAWRDNPLFERAVAACYNSGPSNVSWALRNGYDPDRVTTGKDYGRDVLMLRDGLRKMWPTRFPILPSR